jgi:hypothetical protein
MTLTRRPALYALAGFAGATALAALAHAQTAQPAATPPSQGASQGAAGSTVAPARSTKPKAAPKAEPAAQAVPAAPVTTGTIAPAPAAVFQTTEQLQKAGVKRCLQTAQAVGQATMAGSAQYAAVSTWNNKQPDNRFSVSMIGQQFAAGQNSMPNGLSGVFSVPTAEGKCDAASVQVIPTTDSCAAVQAQILTKGKVLGNLAGVPLLQNAANAQVMLLPAAGNGCVLVALSAIYTE